MKINRRLFVVGCPRSGTTLIQSMLSMHPYVFSVPETHFFSRAYPRNQLKRLVTWPAINVRGIMLNLVHDLNRQDLSQIAKVGFYEPDYTKHFLDVLDRLAMDANKNIWVEKTPLHLHFIRQIETNIPNSLIVHVIRSGKDVVASLYNAKNQYGKKWAKSKKVKGKDLKSCVRRWNKDIQISREYFELSKSNHFFVNYNDVLSHPTLVIKNLCEFCSIAYDESMLSPQQNFSDLVNRDEPWKNRNAEKISEGLSKYKNYLSNEEQLYVLDHLIDIDVKKIVSYVIDD